jgi:hypothetical protein
MQEDGTGLRFQNYYINFKFITLNFRFITCPEIIQSTFAHCDKNVIVLMHEVANIKWLLPHIFKKEMCW